MVSSHNTILFMRIKKGDTVSIMVGKDSGKTGKVLVVYPDDRRVLVEGLNMYKKHIRPRQQGQKGQLVDTARPVPDSNVMIVCGSCHKMTRVAYRIDAGQKKSRVCKKCKAVL